MVEHRENKDFLKLKGKFWSVDSEGDKENVTVSYWTKTYLRK